jgi:uncharacterized protein YkwD
MRTVPVAVAVLTAIVLLAATAPAGASPTAYLAPPKACAGSTDGSASVAVQRRALVCLINWARRRAHLRRLAQHPALSRSADAKAATIVSCGDFSHAPCGSSLTGSMLRAGYRFAIFAENLYWGSQDLGTPRAAMRAWLLSPPHREHVFAHGVRDAGIGRVQASSFAGSANVTVWVLEIGRQR